MPAYRLAARPDKFRQRGEGESWHTRVNTRLNILSVLASIRNRIPSLGGSTCAMRRAVRTANVHVVK